MTLHLNLSIIQSILMITIDPSITVSTAPIEDSTPKARRRWRVYTVGSYGDGAWIEGELVPRMEEAEIVVFPGGSDWDASLYGEPSHSTTSPSPDTNRREIAAFEKAQSLGLKCFGICKGHQLAGIMAGAKLIQDQRHPSTHMVEMHDGQSFLWNSCHHQGVYPWSLGTSDCRVLGWTKGLSPYHKGGRDEEMVNGIVPESKEVEMCHYPKLKALSVQGHPEWMYGTRQYEPTLNHLRGLLDRLMTDTL